jgi:hypothetical protein
LKMIRQMIDTVSAQWMIRKISYPQSKGDDMMYRMCNIKCAKSHRLPYLAQ